MTNCDTSALSSDITGYQSTANGSLATLAGCVSANVVAVSSSAAALSVTDHVLWGTTGAGESVSNEYDSYSDSVDVSTYNKISLYGSSSNLSDEFEVQVSHDDTNWFEMTSVFIQVDYASGHFGKILDAPVKYVRMKKKGTGTPGSDTVWALLSGKK